MSLLSISIDVITNIIPLIVTLILVGLVLITMHHLLIVRRPDLGNEYLLPRQLVMLGLTLLGVLAVTFALPVSESTRNQIIALIGLLISGVLAFSSSTLFANLMAGIMLRVTHPFKTGDFINIGDHFGRVVERGLLDTEIQTENRELVSLPNTYMINIPIIVTRSSGTIVSTTLSLGYDVHHAEIERLLIKAVEACGLNDAFVQVLELGNYAVTYKVSGVLKEVKSLLTARSNLCRHVLDVLHEHNIEIMSPTFMNQRPVPENAKIIPAAKVEPGKESAALAEAVMFDKAEEAEQLEKQKRKLQEELEQLEAALDQVDENDKKPLQERINRYREQIKTLTVAAVAARDGEEA